MQSLCHLATGGKGTFWTNCQTVMKEYVDAAKFHGKKLDGPRMEQHVKLVTRLNVKHAGGCIYFFCATERNGG